MSTCYAAARAGVVVVADAGSDAASVAAGPALTDHDVECLDAASDAPERALCGTFDAGLHRTTDGGETWERVGSDSLPQSVTSVTVSPRDPDVVYAGTEPSAVYRSTDGGESWAELAELTDLPSAPEWSFPPRPDTHHVRWIEVDPGDARHLYVAVEAGALIQTHDGGDTWEERSPTTRRDTHSMAIHPDAPERVRAAAGDGYAESDDGGRNWAFPQEGLKHRYCWSVAVDPGDPDRVLLSSASSARRAHTPRQAASHLYRRDESERGADAAWERLDDAGVPTGEGVLRPTLSSGTEAGELFALTDRGLYRTADGGDSFERVDVAWPDAFREQTTRGLAVV